MRPDIALIILAIIVASIFSLHLLMGFIDCITDNIIRLKQNGIFDDENKTNKKEETKEMNRNMNKIRENLKKRINHRNRNRLQFLQRWALHQTNTKTLGHTTNTTRRHVEKSNL
jgi:hypothetical protein